MDAVRKGPISINKAALLYSVPPTTVKDHSSGMVAHGTKPGPVKYLNDEEECALSDHLIKVVKDGHGKTRGQVKVTVAISVTDTSNRASMSS